jgi:hypothetical protein
VQPHICEVLGTKFRNIRKNNQGKYKYFDCKVLNCPNSNNRIEFNYNIPTDYQKIKLVSTRTTTLTLFTDIAAFGIERQASLVVLPKFSSVQFRGSIA